jgi:hypothetical protein
MQKIKLELKDKPLEPLMKKKSLMITPKKIALFLFVLFLVLVVFYFWKEICFLIKPPALEVSQPPADITVSQDKFEIIGKTTPFAYLILNGTEELYIDKNGNFKKEVTLSVGLNTLKIEAKNRFGKTNTIIRRIIYNPIINN